MDLDTARLTLFYWHHWSVVLRGLAWDPTEARHTSLREALNEVMDDLEIPDRRDAWLDSEDFDPRAVQSLVDCFRELFRALLQQDLSPFDFERLFDVVEILPMRMAHAGPASVERDLDATAEFHQESLPQLSDMASRFRRRPGRSAEPEPGAPRPLPILDRISELLKAAMKQGDRHRVRALRLAKTRLGDIARYRVNEATVRSLLTIMVAENEAQIATYAGADREDLADAEVAEAAVYEELLRELG